MKSYMSNALMLTMLTLSLTSCLQNSKKSEGFMAIVPNNLLSSAGASQDHIDFCAKATDLGSCVDQGPACQGLYKEGEDFETESGFLACIPRMPSGDEVPSGEEPSGEAPNGEVPSDLPGEEQPSGEEPNSTDPVKPQPQLPIPQNCSQVDAKFKIGSKKVVICHHTHSASNPRHSIEISCNALKTHVDHHGDYLGPCQIPASENNL